MNKIINGTDPIAPHLRDKWDLATIAVAVQKPSRNENIQHYEHTEVNDGC